MKTPWYAFLLPPQFPDYEQTQKSKMLHYMLMATTFGGVTFGLTNFLHGFHKETIFMFTFAVISLIGLLLNHTHFSSHVGLIFIVSLFLVICLMLYNGDGLYDETILAIPGFIIFTTFLFGKRGLLVTTVLSNATIIAFYFLQVYGFFESEDRASVLRVFILSSLIVFITLAIWAVRDSWEMNLQHVRESYDLTLQGWAHALEYRDGETAGHTRRAVKLSVRLAQKLGLSQGEIRDLARGAYLHDIGKMAIPDSILLKPGPLTDEEWEIMKQHPVRSKEFISEIPYLQSAIPVAYSHHENWDGSGYPEGLRGEEIPLVARIFTVVDHWDALNSERPYRKAWPREKVLAYLKENIGFIYDPQVVEAFLDMIEQGSS